MDSLYDYFRNDALDANNWFNDNTVPVTRKTAERQNDFGGTFGGPVWIPRLYQGRDKTFFFFSYEGLRLTTPHAAVVTSVPDNTMRATAPAALQPVSECLPHSEWIRTRKRARLVQRSVLDAQQTGFNKPSYRPSFRR